MYSDWSVFANLAMAVLFIWLGFLSFLVWRQNKFLKSLFPKSGERDIRRKFEEMVTKVNEFEQGLGRLREKIIKIEGLDLKHIQKVELSRYNPYDETGGDQSFTFCLLDDQGTGVVVTSLHARSGTRVFAKPVLKGKSEKYQFSKEEEVVLNKALKQ